MYQINGRIKLGVQLPVMAKKINFMRQKMLLLSPRISRGNEFHALES
jgi:hypothetical protein